MKQYRKKGTTPMEPWTPQMGLAASLAKYRGVSISKPDIDNGSPKDGDMIAHNPANPDDRWLVAAAYFAEHYEEAR